MDQKTRNEIHKFTEGHETQPRLITEWGTQMKYLFIVLVIMVIPMGADAQLVDTWASDFFIKTARIRDRNMKFSSPRLEALQMSIAIEDETNALDLDSWGDNRAWLGTVKSNQIKIDTAFGNQKYAGVDEPGSYTGNGAYGRSEYGFELEGMDHSQKDKYSSYIRTQRDSGIGAGWGHAFGNFLTGLHWNDNHTSIKYSDEIDPRKIRYQFAGAAAAVKLGPAAIGITADSVDLGGLRGTKYGAQAVVASNGFKAGLRASNMPLKKELHYYYSEPGQYSLRGFIKELGAKVSWVVPGSSLNLGAEYSNYYENFETTSNGGTHHGGSNVITGSYGNRYYGSRTGSNAITTGAALRLFNDRMIIGAEHKHVVALRYSRIKIRYTTAGVEFRPIERLALRSSYQYRKDTWRGDPDGKMHTGAAGVGYNLSKIFSIDIMCRRSKYIYANSGQYTRATFYDGHLALSARF